jgi:hypothetical protein
MSRLGPFKVEGPGFMGESDIFLERVGGMADAGLGMIET